MDSILINIYDNHKIMLAKIVRRITVYIACALAALSLTMLPAQATAAPALDGMPNVVASTATDRFKQSWSWYISRASGILASILLVLLVLSGIGLLTGYTYRILEPLPAWAAHRAIGISFGVSTFVHIFILFFDTYIGFKLADVFVPFYSQYKTIEIGGIKVGLYMALGVLAMYAIAAVIISSLLWMQKKPKPWRLLHYTSYAIVAMVFIHGLFMGTDLKGGILRFLWIAGGVALVAAVIPRLRRAGTLDREP